MSTPAFFWNMTFGAGAYLVGCVLLAVTLGSCAGVAWLVTRAWLGHLRGSPRWLALATVWTAAVVFVHLLPGALTILSRATVPICALLLLGATAYVTRGSRVAAAASGEPGPDVPDTTLSRTLGSIAVLAFLACAVALELKLLGHQLIGQDTTNFQVPTVARWIQKGSLWGLNQWTPNYSIATYPQNGNLLILAFVLPFHRPFLAPLEPALFLLLAMVAGYAIARELHAPRGTAMLGAALFASLPRATDVGLRGTQTDLPGIAMLAVGVLFLLRHRRTGLRSELVLAGLALGLAIGTKWYGVSYGAAIIAMWALAMLIARRRVRPVLGAAALVAGVAALAGGFWFIRNWVETGDPVFPVKVAVAGLTVFDAAPDISRQLGGFTLLHYAGNATIFRDYVKPGFSSDFGLLTLLALALGTLVAGVLALRRPRRADVMAVVVGAIVLAVLYADTPYSAYGPAGHPVLLTSSTRYALPALLLAAAVTAWAVARSGMLRPLLEVALLALVINGLRKGFPGLAPGALVAGAAIAVTCAIAARASARELPRMRPAMAIAAALALALVLLAAGDGARSRWANWSYAGADPVYGALAHLAPANARVGLAGAFPVNGISPTLPAMGPDLTNSVEFVGHFDRGFLRRYDQGTKFVAALRSGHYDALLVGHRLSPHPPELAWARAAGFVPVASSARMTLLRRRRPLTAQRPGA